MLAFKIEDLAFIIKGMAPASILMGVIDLNRIPVGVIPFWNKDFSFRFNIFFCFIFKKELSFVDIKRITFRVDDDGPWVVPYKKEELFIFSSLY